MQTAAVDTLVTNPLFYTPLMLSFKARITFAVDLDVFVLLLWASGRSTLAGTAGLFGAGLPLGILSYLSQTNL